MKFKEYFLSEAKIEFTPKFEKWLKDDMGKIDDDGKKTTYYNIAKQPVFSVDNKTKVITIHQKDLEAIDLEAYGAKIKV